MKDTVTEYEFVDRIMRLRPDNFTREGLFALFEYLTQLEEDCGVEMEFDPIALCCEFTEYENIEEFQNWGPSTISDIREQTTVIQINDEAFIIQDF